MKLPRNVDGDVLAAHLVRRWAYVYIRQTGSHVRLRTDTPSTDLLTIPMHFPLKPGTLASILKQVANHKGVTVEQFLAGL